MKNKYNLASLVSIILALIIITISLFDHTIDGWIEWSIGMVLIILHFIFKNAAKP